MLQSVLQHRTWSVKSIKLPLENIENVRYSCGFIVPFRATIKRVYVEFAVLILKFDPHEVLCADCRNVVTFVLSRAIFSVLVIL